MTGFTPDAVANEFLRLGQQAGRETSPMKLQKLMYYAHGWHLGLYAVTEQESLVPLVNEEPQAWGYGPVFPSTYQEFKDFGASPIKRYAGVVAADLRVVEPVFEDEREASEIDVEFARAVVQKIWERYGNYTAMTLSEMTHEKGTPWYQVRAKARKKYGKTIPRGMNIPHLLIRDWFRSRMNVKPKE